jgi:hypothetical protein
VHQNKTKYTLVNILEKYYKLLSIIQMYDEGDVKGIPPRVLA